MYDKILIATDGSPTANKAARLGADLVKTLKSSSLLLHVGDDERGAQVLAETVRDTGLDGETMSVHGDAADKILEVAEQKGVDLIIVGNKGMTGAKRFLLGSVPNQVSHHAPCNVLIVKTT